MDLGLAGRTAIISGASTGIGFATAQLFAKEGARLMITARSADRLDAARAQLEAETGAEVFALAADMTDAAGVKSVVAAAEAQLGPVDIAIANVVGHKVKADGEGPPPGHFADVPADQYRVEFRQLVLSVWYLARLTAPGMRERGWGRIVSISSGVARESAWHLPHILPNAVRPAAAAVCRDLARHYAGTGVTANNILTGNIATQRNVDYMQWLAQERGATYEDTVRENCDLIPLRRPGKPEEMAATIGFVCSPWAAAINGHSIHMSGGSSKHIY